MSLRCEKSNLALLPENDNFVPPSFLYVTNSAIAIIEKSIDCEIANQNTLLFVANKKTLYSDTIEYATSEIIDVYLDNSLA